ncbi:MAG: glycoside hydrolase family 3 C-terminal domain-containing protein [Clostridia bacterium]|nr:glycoside hydrolase family 3 C-terminal domain-containing protein [Clostridia bacterium]
MKKNYEKQIDSLLAKMSLQEKIGQLNQPETPTADNEEAFMDLVRKGLVGSVLMSVGATAGNDPQGSISVDFYNRIQKTAIEESPNGIPVLFGRDVIHGHKTVFPIPLAMTASFNEELIEQSYRDIAQEASNESVHWTFTPMLDLCHDPRWGRIIEGTGEDPYLGSVVAKAVVKGLQGENVGESDRILACAKHYIGYGASEGGRDYHRTEISDYTLFNYYLPAFKGAIDAGALTVMSAFNDISGQPITSSRRYLTEILRDKLGFQGLVVADYDAVCQLERQGVAESEADCASMALNAGIDLDMHDFCYLNELESLVENGKVSMETIDTAVKRVLSVKFEAGLFDTPYCVPKDYDKAQHRLHSREMAAESMVLLKNENHLLPLQKSADIALVGPFATERRTLLGSWMLDGKERETPNLLETLRGRTSGTVESSNGTDLSLDRSLRWMTHADVIVLALGEKWTDTGESRAVSTASIPNSQIELIRRAKATGKKIVGVLFCGRPVVIEEIADLCDALIYAWHSGSEAANAVCDLLFGDSVPSGRLPVTLLRSSNHIPLYYNVTSSGRPVNCYYGENPGECYVDSLPTPYYPFGYGLSYTEFAYGDICCNTPQLRLEDLKNGQKFRFEIDLHNVGDFDAKETVQLYIHDRAASMMRPLRELKAFQKVFVKRGETCRVVLELGFEDLGFYLPSGEYTVEAGKFDIYIGENCLTPRKTEISVL